MESEARASSEEPEESPGAQGEMAGRGMESVSTGGEMSGGTMNPEKPEEEKSGGELRRVLVEMRVPENRGAAAALESAASMDVPAFNLDGDYDPVPVGTPPADAAPSREGERERPMWYAGRSKKAGSPNWRPSPTWSG